MYANKQYNKEKFLEESPELYYWMGFLYADGTLIYNQKHWYLHLEIALKDEEHLFKFASFIEYTGDKIYYRTKPERHITASNRMLPETKSCSLSINVSEICDVFPKFGIIQSKTYKWLEPSLNLDYLNHFIRGLIDGDGCVSLVKASTKKTLNPSIYIVSKTELSEWINKSLLELNYTGTNRIFKIKKENTYPIERFIISGRHNITKICKIIDSTNELKLERKWNKMNNYLATYIK